VNAETTAIRVLTWAVTPVPDGARELAPPPVGPLREATALRSPRAATTAAVAALTRRTAARLGAGAPPFGDRSAVGPGALLLAAAVGGVQGNRAEAEILVDAVPPRRLDRPGAAAGWCDALARHAVASAVPAGFGGEEFGERLRAASPLTAVLGHPVGRATAAPTATALNLMARPHGKRVLQDVFARCVPQEAVLAWRTELLMRLLPDDPAFVLDVYLAARLRHGVAWDQWLAISKDGLSRVIEPDPLLLAVARWWGPLARLVAAHPDLVRSRALLTGHEPALALVARHRLAGAAA
jgi:hypothetical protein